MILGWDMERAHAGSGASFSGVSTRNGDLLTLFVKNAGNSAKPVISCMIVNHFDLVCRISAQGCDVLD